MGSSCDGSSARHLEAVSGFSRDCRKNSFPRSSPQLLLDTVCTGGVDAPAPEAVTAGNCILSCFGELGRLS